MPTHNRPLSVIAREIRSSWKTESPYARPYVDAMMSLSNIDSFCHQDSASDIVTRFLCNAHSWRGQKARDIKAELLRMLQNAKERRNAS
jgi:hypothetical protein